MTARIRILPLSILSEPDLRGGREVLLSNGQVVEIYPQEVPMHNISLTAYWLDYNSILIGDRVTIEGLDEDNLVFKVIETRHDPGDVHCILCLEVRVPSERSVEVCSKLQATGGFVSSHNDCEANNNQKANRNSVRKSAQKKRKMKKAKKNMDFPSPLMFMEV